MKVPFALSICLSLATVGAGFAQADADGAARIIAALERSHAHFHPGKPVSVVTLDRCQLTMTDTANRQVFGGIDHLNLADLDLSAPAFVYEMSDEMWRLDLKESDRFRRAVAPALWRLMDGEDADRPDFDAVMEKSAEWDPLGMGSWNDPSMMTALQQTVHDHRWRRALEGAGGDVLARSHSEWLGPEVDGERRVYRIAGARLGLALPPGEVEPFMELLRGYIGETCP